MDVADLKVVDAVARHGSMNKAASELNTVQSNVSARIRSLEDELGVALFQRSAKGVQVTPAGRRILPFAARLSKLLLDASSAARDDGHPKGVLEIGTLETTLALRLPHLIAQFAKAYPEVRPVVRTGTTCSLIQGVIDCKLEGAFVAGPVNHPELHSEEAFREELVLVTSPALHSLDDVADVENLKTVVFRIGCSYRQRLDTLLTSLGVLAPEPLEFGSIEAIIACASAGVGVTLLPRGVVANAAREGLVAVHDLPPELAEVETVFVRRIDGYFSSALASFLHSVRMDAVPALPPATVAL
ncbi:LysR substrate-binding domain-containing protein [Pseudomonas fluorescens]|jgi:DNA-binding transcriptional LysR family regulator|uniref:LysR family transcriptional regulator n=1 Tax=Pseudomonas TaxID=286 RepID=UPI001A935CDE|nr:MULTISPECIES: LysR family transcriptional regulator [Pseudomonas]MDZ5431692.1 LysR substrate-binding domain-containing protein [Pseudomonas fluorescens]